MAEAAVREAMGARFDAVAESDRNDYETPLKVDNLLLMYDAVMLLLSDTTLEMRKDSCYGVVGQNGAGKTTFVKEIVSGYIVGMPKHLKFVYVADSKLGESSKSCLSVVEYLREMALDIGVLSDTTLEMRKDSCYGVVGQNGAGKATLVKEIVSGYIMEMPKHLKFVYVDDAKLGEMSKSCLSAFESLRETALDIGVTNASGDTLLSVGFEVRGAVRPVALRAGNSCGQVWSTCACRHSGLLRDLALGAMVKSPLALRGCASQSESSGPSQGYTDWPFDFVSKPGVASVSESSCLGRAAYHFWGGP